MGRVGNLNDYMIDNGRGAVRSVALVAGVIIAATVVVATLFAWTAILLVSSGVPN